MHVVVSVIVKDYKSFFFLMIILGTLFSCTEQNKKADDSSMLASDSTLVDELNNEANGFTKELTFGTLKFDIVSSNDRLNITTTGLEKGTDTINLTIEGTIYDAEVADLDQNGFPEVYCFCSSAGSGSYGQVYAYASNNNKSLSTIFLPDIEEDNKNSEGYMGHDLFKIEGNKLTRSFPVYKETDPNASPSGGVRKITYKLKAGEAGWVLIPDTDAISL